MANSLNKETSPYLLQHKNNPVDWFAWSNQTLLLAKKLRKPILLSIGYSACHWCHVMAHESFEDNEIAKIMNKHFINIKVDREERPDLDSYYQTALTLLGQRGGWPLTMFLDINTKPFWGGTYFPKTARYGLRGFGDILLNVSDAFHKSKQSIVKNSNILVEGINKSNFIVDTSMSQNKKRNSLKNNYLSPVNGVVYTNRELTIIFKTLEKYMDFDNGGIVGNMKFPQSPTFKAYYAGLNLFAVKDNVTKTILSQCVGGIYDHVGGGVSRYTVDNIWLVPHFEKMLYDSANFIEILAILSNKKLKTYFKNKIDHVLVWLKEEMCVNENNKLAFYSAIDADSEGVEGKYYVWTLNELRQILGKEAHYLQSEYGANEIGNWEGSNILNRLKFIDEDNLKREFSKKNKLILAKIKEHRKKRVPPQKDIKILTDWNLMLCSALVRVGKSYEDKNYYNFAKQILNYFEDKIGIHKNLFHSYCNDSIGHEAFLSDYASLIKAYIGFYLCEFNPYYLNKAVKYADQIINNYYDPKKCVFYYSPINKNITNNSTNVFDAATQSGAGMMLENLFFLNRFTNKNRYLEIVDDCIKLAWPSVYKNPFALSSYIHAANLVLNSYHIVVIEKDKKSFLAIKKYLRKSTVFNTYVCVKDGLDLDKNNPAYGKKPVNNKTTVYICSGSSCYEPINDLGSLMEKTKQLPMF